MPATASHDRQTFLFADLAGFTALTEAHGDERAADLVDGFCRRTRALLGQHGAEEVKAIGDALMLRTDDAAAGVGLAVRLAEDVGGQHGFPGVRVGVHTGPAVSRGGDWFGATVNVASRVSGAATAGEALITRATREAAGAGLADLAVRPRGGERFKNVAEPVELFAVNSSAARVSHELSVDPVCHMTVDRSRARKSHTLRGRTLYFCSDACAATFVANPERFARRRNARPTLRVSDAARDRAVSLLRRAYARGRLGQEELEERVAHALAARTRQELNVALEDLPERRELRSRGRWLPRLFGGRRRER